MTRWRSAIVDLLCSRFCGLVLTGCQTVPCTDSTYGDIAAARPDIRLDSMVRSDRDRFVTAIDGCREAARSGEVWQPPLQPAP